MNPRWEMPQFEDQSMQVEFEARQAHAGLKRERDPDSADDTSVDASPVSVPRFADPLEAPLEDARCCGADVGPDEQPVLASLHPGAPPYDVLLLAALDAANKLPRSGSEANIALDPRAGGGVFDFTAAEVAATKAATTCTTNEIEAPPTTFRPTIRFTTAATVI